MDQKIKIDKGIPIPSARTGGRVFVQKYPFGDMEIGDSFLIKKNLSKSNKLRVKQASNIRSSLAHCLRKYNKRRENPIQITTRTLDEGMRVWRIK